MATKRRRLIRRTTVLPFAGRGMIYAWLRTHFLQVRALREQGERPWSLILLDMTDDGIAGIRSAALTDFNVGDTWLRVVRDVAAAEAVAASRPQRPTPPSKTRGDVRPQVVPAPYPTSPLAPPAAPPSYPAAVQPPGPLMADPATGAETFDDLKKRLKAEFRNERPNYSPP